MSTNRSPMERWGASSMIPDGEPKGVNAKGSSTFWWGVNFLLIVVALNLAVRLVSVLHYGDVETATSAIDIQKPSISHVNDEQPNRLLYIVTSSSEYTSQKRKFTRHHDRDRLLRLIVPVMREGIESLQQAGFEVDLFLILAYNLTESRRMEIDKQLPIPSDRIHVWEEAVPYSYEQNMKRTLELKEVGLIHRALARQHRYVVRDLLFDYDIFCAFEDDMLIKGHHVKHHLYLSQLLDSWRHDAPEEVAARAWHGPIAQRQIPRIRPGFIRVEVLVDNTVNETQEKLENVPLDFDFSDLEEAGPIDNPGEIDASFCCRVEDAGQSVNEASMRPPRHPDSRRIMLWESGIEGMYIREMPNGMFMGLMSGGAGGEYEVGRLFSGELRKLDSRVPPHHAKLLAQSAGWIMTRKQLLEMHVDLCHGSFMPPFELPHFEWDGIFLNNVEFWSGGIQMWVDNGCGIQRILQLDPGNFSKHLLYHTGNNKQLQRARDRRVLANTLLGQFNTIRKDAIAKKKKELK